MLIVAVPPIWWILARRRDFYFYFFVLKVWFCRKVRPFDRQRPVWFVFRSVLWGGKLQSLLVLCYIYSGACYRNREIFLFVTSLKLIWRNWDERVIFVHVKALLLLSFLDFDWCLVILDSWFWLWSSTATFPPIFFGRLMDPNDYSSCNQIAWSSKMGFFFFFCSGSLFLSRSSVFSWLNCTKHFGLSEFDCGWCSSCSIEIHRSCCHRSDYGVGLQLFPQFFGFLWTLMIIVRAI